MRIHIRNVLCRGRQQDVVIADGTIEAIVDHYTGTADRSIDGTNKVILPSLINGHTHAAMTLFRGFADDMPLNAWLNGKIWPLEAKLTPDDVYWGSKLACLEMIRNGITAFNDMYWQWEATAQAVSDMGIRGLISAVFIDRFENALGDEQIAENVRLFDAAKRYGPAVTFTFGPHAIYTVSKRSLQWMEGFSRDNNILIHMHLSETAEEVAFSREKYGCSPVEFLDRLGVLSERFIGCHGCALSEADLGILKKRRASLVHVPVSNLKLAVGNMFPHRLAAGLGIPFCFGTDGCASNNHLDLFETMKFASLLAKYHANDPTVMPAEETFLRATGAAASIFGLGQWEIEVGKSPDVILVDLLRPEFTPHFHLYSDLVYAANGYCVDTVICMGKVVMEGRHVPGEREIMDRAALVAKSLAER